MMPLYLPCVQSGLNPPQKSTRKHVPEKVLLTLGVRHRGLNSFIRGGWTKHLELPKSQQLWLTVHFSLCDKSLFTNAHCV